MAILNETEPPTKLAANLTSAFDLCHGPAVVQLRKGIKTMMHRSRVWGVTQSDAIDELTNSTWTLCAAFETPAGTIWANDSTNVNALQEYGVLRRQGDDWRQVETITVSWCKPAEMREFIRRADAGEFDKGMTFGTVSAEQLERNHKPCPLCA